MPDGRPLRILSVGNLYPPRHLGGYELVWQAAVRGLRRAGHDVRVVTTTTSLGGLGRAGADPPEEDPDVHRELRWYWHAHRFPRMTLGRRLRLERHNHEVLGRHLAELHPDVVSWWHMGGMSLSLVERVRRLGIPALGWVNDDWLIYGPRVDAWTRVARRAGPLAGGAERVLGVPTELRLDTAARWVFCSDVTRQATLRHRPRLADTAVLHQGAAGEFAPAPPRAWGGRLLYVGRLDPRKGVATLLGALDALPGATLRVVGDGDPAEVSRLRARADPARVDFAGPLPRRDLPAAYAGADAVVFPVEWSEPYGLVPLEAMAVGRPVVATGLGGSAEYLEHEVNALLFPAGDAEALAVAVRRLAADPELRGRLRAGGLRTAARLTEAAWTAAVVAEHEAVAGRPPLSPAAR